MNKLKEVYGLLHNTYGPQGWWPIVNDKTLLCEYHTNAPKNEAESFEIAVGAILTQGTQWYPNVVRAIQQLKLGRTLTIKEWEVLREAEISQKKISGNEQLITQDNILTQNTSWTNVEKALKELYDSGNLSRGRIRALPVGEIAGLIRSAGYFNQKAKKLKLLADFKGEITRENLLGIWGIGLETADSILLYAYQEPVFVVDAYTRRIFSRLGLVGTDVSYDDIQKVFHENLKKDVKIFKEYHALIVEHAKRHCRAKPECNGCPIAKFCKCNSEVL